MVLVGIVVGGAGTYIGFIVKMSNLGAEIRLLRQMLETHVNYHGEQLEAIKTKQGSMCSDLKEMQTKVKLHDVEFIRMSRRISVLEDSRNK